MELYDFLISDMIQYGIDNKDIEIVEAKFKEIESNEKKEILR